MVVAVPPEQGETTLEARREALILAQHDRAYDPPLPPFLRSAYSSKSHASGLEQQQQQQQQQQQHVSELSDTRRSQKGLPRTRSHGSWFGRRLPPLMQQSQDSLPPTSERLARINELGEVPWGQDEPRAEAAVSFDRFPHLIKPPTRGSVGGGGDAAQWGGGRPPSSAGRSEAGRSEAGRSQGGRSQGGRSQGGRSLARSTSSSAVLLGSGSASLAPQPVSLALDRPDLALMRNSASSFDLRSERGDNDAASVCTGRTGRSSVNAMKRRSLEAHREHLRRSLGEVEAQLGRATHTTTHTSLASSVSSASTAWYVMRKGRQLALAPSANDLWRPSSRAQGAFLPDPGTLLPKPGDWIKKEGFDE